MPQIDVIKIIKKYIEILIQNGIKVRHAFLFGSYSTNTSTQNSDIDVMVVTELAYDDNLIGKIWSLTSKINTKIEPFVVSMNQFNQSENSPLIQLVKNEGILVC
ncbi:MAG TPA: nucleotidyltransferase domain-containing protein [Candidatus Kapabacteria bacterium]|nr:nucleotidyltransferase domain-containing protein [Candidatus Kapabacteria bacterium]